jgi:hypothetical protein
LGGRLEKRKGGCKGEKTYAFTKSELRLRLPKSYICQRPLKSAGSAKEQRRAVVEELPPSGTGKTSSPIWSACVHVGARATLDIAHRQDIELHYPAKTHPIVNCA